jgi:hypothetical protein
MARDLTWVAIFTVAERMTERYDTALTIRAARRRSLLGWNVTDGLEVVDNWTRVFEPVRTRSLLGRTWNEVQPVQEAASKVGTFIRDRPDLAGK